MGGEEEEGREGEGGEIGDGIGSEGDTVHIRLSEQHVGINSVFFAFQYLSVREATRFFWWDSL